MDEKFISSILIDKLGHNIVEIRVRALENIISKLERGFLYDNKLARSKELLIKLLDWFKFDVILKEEPVLGLLERILKSDTGSMLIDLFGKESLYEELSSIQAKISPNSYDNMKSILKLLDTKSSSTVSIPPLNLEGWSTNRSDGSLHFLDASETEHDTCQGTSQTDLATSQNQRTTSQKDDDNSDRIQPCLLLTWQPLTASDRNVLETLQEKLRNTMEPTDVLNTCEFFSNILLHDFPAEVFLQRPTIVNILHELLWTSPSSRLTTSILKCLEKLTSALQHRVDFYRDPSVYNKKDEGYYAIEYNSVDGNSNSELSVLQSKQISLPDYCLKTMLSMFEYIYINPASGDKFTRKKCQLGTNASLRLLRSSIHLLKSSLGRNFFKHQDDPFLKQFSSRMYDTLTKFGEVLKYYRLQTISTDWQEDSRFTHLYLVSVLSKFLRYFIHDNRFVFELPPNLKQLIADSLSDPALIELFSDVNKDLITYTHMLSKNTNLLQTHEHMNMISKSMTSTVQILRDWKQFTFAKTVSLIKQSLLSLELHKNHDIIRIIFEVCSNKYDPKSFDDCVLNDVDDIIVGLLSHHDEKIKLETYKQCHKKVIFALGAKSNVEKMSLPGRQALFLIRSKILEEIILFGMTDVNVDIQTSSEDILLHVLKCKILVNDCVWDQALLAIIPNLPLLVCFMNNRSLLGNTILSMLDPDKSLTLKLPSIEVFKSNLSLLFLESNLIRGEAISRICWNLANHNDHLLPRINSLHDKTWANVFSVDRKTDYKAFKCIQHFYQPSGVIKVLDLLKQSNVEPVIRRSGITQLSVMLEDPLLHPTFLDNSGIDAVKAMLFSALTPANFNDYPDAVIPCISILKSICLYNAAVRTQLSNDLELYYYITRGLFLFFTELRVKDEASTLLFLLVFNQFVKGSTLKNDLSLPELVHNKLRIPFECHRHWKRSPNVVTSNINTLLEDKWNFKSLQIHWNAAWFGGIENLLEKDVIKYTTKDNFNNLLKLNQTDVLSIKTACIEYTIKKYLQQMAELNNHNDIILTIQKIELLINLNLVASNNLEVLCDIEWEKYLNVYLMAPPSSIQDYQLLMNIFNLLKTLLPYVIYSDTFIWISTFLQSKSNYTIDLLLQNSSKDSNISTLLHSLLDLIKVCVNCGDSVDGGNLKDLHPSKWFSLIEIISQCLHFEDSNYFYDLVYLNNLLSTLVLLTSRIGWSQSKQNEPLNKCLSNLNIGLFRLIDSFYCGKGLSASESFMGLSITRHVILILNHTINEMQIGNVKNWEKCFIDEEINGKNILLNLTLLSNCRDVVIRAGLFQYFSGAVLSREIGLLLIKDAKINNKPIIEALVALFIDLEEASLVKENVVNLLTNFISHVISGGESHKLIKHPDLNAILDIITILSRYNVYKEMENIFTHLYVNKYFYNISSNEDEHFFLTTPGYLKSLILLFHNLLVMNPQRIINIFNMHGLTKTLFRCLTIPNMHIQSNSDFLLYNDILQMNTVILELLMQLMQNNDICLQSVLNTRDYLVIMLSLLNSELYYVHSPEMVLLRNKLWSIIFNFIEVILTTSIDDNENFSSSGFLIIHNILSERNYEDFLLTMCESLLCQQFEDLQSSSLSALTVILQVTKIYAVNHEFPSSTSFQTLLDTKTSPRSFCDSRSDVTNDNINKFGRELCKILINLYETSSCKKPPQAARKRELIVNALSSLLLTSHEAKKYALAVGLLTSVISQVGDIQNRLNLETLDFMRRSADKKRIVAVLKELEHLFGLLTNFMINDSDIKEALSRLNIVDVLHKLWTWCTVQKSLLEVVLKMLCTHTTDCIASCNSIPYTNGNPGSGPRKVATNMCILDSIVKVINTEMNQISRTHELNILFLALEILENVLVSVDCRFILTKLNLFSSITRVHPLATRRQKPWDEVELIWLKFIREFTIYSEGQLYIAKAPDVLDIVMLVTNSNRRENRRIALEILRNVSFHHQNRAKLLASDMFLKILHTKLNSEYLDENFIIVSIVSALVCNNQKGKLILKCAGIHTKLLELIKMVQFTDCDISAIDIDKMKYVLRMLKEGGD